MLFSCDWLSDYVDLPEDRGELARLLTAAGLAVELIEETDDGDTVFDIDVTTNRVDAMNHLGLAREVAVVTGAALREPEDAVEEAGESAASVIRVVIDAPELCTRYAARVIRGVAVGPSPEWMARRLRAIGLRPINNVVDVTNYVLWEMGQPLHGFDLEEIGGGEIRVRRAARGEKVVTLDEVERELEPDMLVIADASKAVALAGVMGGHDTEVTEGTEDVLLESAWFDPLSVRRTAKALGMHTDASHRFERGADPEVQARAASRAARLIAETGGGTVLAGVVDEVAATHATRHRTPTIPLDLDRLDAFAGVAMPEGKPEEWLTGLGCTVERTGGRTFEVTIPSWRLSDLEETADLYEEVLRIHGYDDVPSTLPSLGEPDAPPTPLQELRRRLRRELAGCGYAEAINWAFHSHEEAERYPALGEGAAGERPVELTNPLSELYAVMRRSLLPGLVASA
ncbi:MAG: phenylalanine--tRNA ligase subunit beta, partial [Acidobacteriota bacterium]